jgi:xylulokinase
MSVFKNGGIVVNEIKNTIGCQNWKEFDEILSKTNPGNDGNIGFYFKFPEITPTTSKSGFFRFKNGEMVKSFENEIECRALIESQYLALKIHSKRLGIVNPTRIICTGGGSQSRICSQILSDIFGCSVFTNQHQDSAPLGAALRALHSFNIFVNENFLPIGDTDFKSTISKLEDFEFIAKPNQEAFNIYSKMELEFEKLEEIVIKELNS